MSNSEVTRQHLSISADGPIDDVPMLVEKNL
jgi:hypothetical protein